MVAKDRPKSDPGTIQRPKSEGLERPKSAPHSTAMKEKKRNEKSKNLTVGDVLNTPLEVVNRRRRRRVREADGDCEFEGRR